MARKNLLTTLLRFLIRFYRYSFSYFLGGRCRYLPTCSDYADEALRIYGPFKGSWLAVKRFCRCHPFSGHGYDPVPENLSEKKAKPSV